MSRKSLKVGIVALLSLVIAVSAMGSVNAADVYVSFTNNTTVADYVVKLYFEDVTNKTATTQTLNVTYRDVFSVQVYSLNTSLLPNARYVDLIFYRLADGVIIKKYLDLEEGDKITIDTYDLDMKPTLYWFKVAIKDGDKNAIGYFTSKNETDLGDGNRAIKVDGYTVTYLNISVDPSVYTKPLIEVDVKNPNNKVVVGDDLRIKVKVWGSNTFKWWFKKYANESFADTGGNNLTAGKVTDSTVNYAEETIIISTYELFNQTSDAAVGDHTIVFKSADAEVEEVVTIEKPSITVNADRTSVIPGGEIKFSGATNVVETDSDYDNATTGSNYVFFFVFNNTDYSKAEVKYIPSLKNFTVEYQGVDKIVCSADGSYYDPTNMSLVGLQYIATFTNNRSVIASDGTFERKFTIPSTAEADKTWQVIAVVMPATSDTLLANASSNLLENSKLKDVLIGKDSLTFDVEKPTITFTMTETSFARGEKFKVTGDTNLPEGSTIYVVFENANTLSSDIDGTPTSAVTNGRYVTVTVGANGKFETDEYEVNSNADLTTYDIYAVWDTATTLPSSKAQWDKYVSTTIRVVKQTLDVTVSPTTVVKGGKLTISGNTTVDKVYVYCSESGILSDVAELPTPTTLYPTSTHRTLGIVVSDNQFRKDIDVESTADVGSYTLYIYAPASSTVINTAEDAQKTIIITVSDVGFVDYPEKITIVKGQSKDVVVKVSAEDNEDVYINAT